MIQSCEWADLRKKTWSFEEFEAKKREVRKVVFTKQASRIDHSSTRIDPLAIEKQRSTPLQQGLILLAPKAKIFNEKA